MTSLPSSPSTENGVGLSDAQLSGPRRKLLDLVNRLHGIGLQGDLDLPLIAVIGSQSAGKSSLIEAISGITLPRAAGTCTRCPTECKLAHSTDAWKCMVYVRFSKDEPFGPPITDKSQVEERIRRAQRAILNPSKPYQQFLEGEDVDGPAELSFSTNCVSLQISGPDVADLSFCDLPGLIASVSSSGQESDIRLIENLVGSYISKPSCIILLTVACETDFENQGAHRLVKQKDPEGKRTIGVLTKPDRIPTSDEPRWIQFIRNEREPLENGWYSVKQPSSSQIRDGITWEQARQNETAYFEGSPWNELDSTFKQHLGTKNLVNKLSLILSDLIARRLPEIQEEIQTMLIRTEEQLGLLPKPLSNDPFAELMVMLQEFNRDVSQHVKGIAKREGLLQRLRPEQVTFKKAILNTAPKFRPYRKTSAQAKKIKLSRPDFLKSDDAAGQDMEGDVADMIYVDEVHSRAQDARSRELPDNYPFDVKQSYIDEFVDKWKPPCNTLHHAVTEIVGEYMKELATVHFSRFSHNGLDQRVKIILTDHVKLCANNALDKISWLLELEEPAYTLNTHYLSEYRSKFLAYYKAARSYETNPSFMGTILGSQNPYQRPSTPVMKEEEYADVVHDSPYVYSPPRASIPSRVPDTPPLEQVLQGFARLGIHVTANEVAKILPADEMESALDIMAEVRAYFQVAYKRITDTIPLALDYEIVRGVTRGLLTALMNGLGLIGPDGTRISRELMQENHTIASKRHELTLKLQKLKEASRELMCVTV